MRIARAAISLASDQPRQPRNARLDLNLIRQRIAEPKRTAAATILSRFLQTHALVGLRDVLSRYPLESAWAERTLEEWSRAGRLVVLPTPAEDRPLRWSEPDNLEQVQRASLALLRREVISCSPQEFADFVLRWQHVHPATRCRACRAPRA